MSLQTSACGGCSSAVLCHCLQVTEDVVLDVITRVELCTVSEVCLRTGAGDGCRACRRKIQRFIDDHSPSSSSSMCSAR
jgi:bacterioferritin-associated ferredoxin